MKIHPATSLLGSFLDDTTLGGSGGSGRGTGKQGFQRPDSSKAVTNDIGSLVQGGEGAGKFSRVRGDPGGGYLVEGGKGVVAHGGSWRFQKG